MSIFDPSNDWFKKKDKILVDRPFLERHVVRYGGNEITVSGKMEWENDSTRQFIGSAGLVTSWENNRYNIVAMANGNPDLISFPVGPTFAHVVSFSGPRKISLNEYGRLDSRWVIRLTEIVKGDKLLFNANGFRIGENGTIEDRFGNYYVELSLFDFEISKSR